jgi:hypothetical protein
MWADWKIAGLPDPFVRPWLDVPIVVVGYELVKLQTEASPEDATTAPF